MSPHHKPVPRHVKWNMVCNADWKSQHVGSWLQPLFDAGEAVNAPRSTSTGRSQFASTAPDCSPRQHLTLHTAVQSTPQYSSTELNKPRLAVQWRILRITFCAGSGCAAARPAAAGSGSRAAAASLAGESAHGRADGPLRLPLPRGQG